jgi:hypothetical protein
MSKMKWTSAVALVTATGALVAWQAGVALSASADTVSASSDRAILRGERQVTIMPRDGDPMPSDGPLAVDAKGNLYWGDDGEHKKVRFVLAPVAGAKHQIKYAEKDAQGRESCFGLRNNGSRPMTVVATLCNTARAGQLWSIVKHGAPDDNGKQAYTINSGGNYLSADGKSLTVKKLNGAEPNLWFTFADNGPSPLKK